MDLLTWFVLGLIIGVVATAWEKPLQLSRLILLMIIGAIGSVSGGVIGYLLFGASIEWFDFSIFSTALIVTTLVIIIKRKITQLQQTQIKPQQPMLFLPEHSTMTIHV